MVNVTIPFAGWLTECWRRVYSFVHRQISNPIFVKLGFCRQEIVVCLLHSIVPKREANKNGRFSAPLALVTLISGREIDVLRNVAFCGNNKIFEVNNRIAFLLLLRPTYTKQSCEFYFVYFLFGGAKFGWGGGCMLGDFNLISLKWLRMF